MLTPLSIDLSKPTSEGADAPVSAPLTGERKTAFAQVLGRLEPDTNPTLLQGVWASGRHPAAGADAPAKQSDKPKTNGKEPDQTDPVSRIAAANMLAPDNIIPPRQYQTKEMPQDGKQLSGSDEKYPDAPSVVTEASFEIVSVPPMASETIPQNPTGIATNRGGFAAGNAPVHALKSAKRLPGKGKAGANPLYPAWSGAEVQGFADADLASGPVTTVGKGQPQNAPAPESAEGMIRRANFPDPKGLRERAGSSGSTHGKPHTQTSHSTMPSRLPILPDNVNQGAGGPIAQIRPATPGQMARGAGPAPASFSTTRPARNDPAMPVSATAQEMLPGKIGKQAATISDTLAQSSNTAEMVLEDRTPVSVDGNPKIALKQARESGPTTPGGKMRGFEMKQSQSDTPEHTVAGTTSEKSAPPLFNVANAAVSPPAPRPKSKPGIQQAKTNPFADLHLAPSKESPASAPSDNAQSPRSDRRQDRGPLEHSKPVSVNPNNLADIPEAPTKSETHDRPDMGGQVAATEMAGIGQQQRIAHHPFSPVHVSTSTVAHHVAQQIAAHATDAPDRPIRLLLNPKELGYVHLTLSIRDASVSVAILVERPETMDLMRRHIHTLAQEFQHLGYGETRFQFSQQGQQQHQGSGPADLSRFSDSSNQPAGQPDDLPVHTPVHAPVTVAETSGLNLRL